MNFTRRRFVQSAVAIGVAGVSFSLIRLQTSARAVAATPPAPTRVAFTYKGRQVEILETVAAVDVWIDGKHQHHIKKLGVGRYASHMFPFKDDSDVSALVKGLIDAAEAELFVL